MVVVPVGFNLLWTKAIVSEPVADLLSFFLFLGGFPCGIDCCLSFLLLPCELADSMGTLLLFAALQVVTVGLVSVRSRLSALHVNTAENRLTCLHCNASSGGFELPSSGHIRPYELISGDGPTEPHTLVAILAPAAPPPSLRVEKRVSPVSG